MLYNISLKITITNNNQLVYLQSVSQIFINLLQSAGIVNSLLFFFTPLLALITETNSAPNAYK